MDSQTPTPVADNGKTIAIISYITLIGLIIAFIMHSSNKTALGAFHIRQMLLLSLVGIVASFINIIPILGQIVWLIAGLGMLVLWVMGLIAAVNGEMKPMPLIGEKAQELFAGI